MSHHAHDFYRRLLTLSIHAELDDLEAGLLDEHLEGCLACRQELAELRSLQALLREQAAPVPDELLSAARSNLMREIAGLAPEPRREAWGPVPSGKAQPWWSGLWSWRFSGALAGLLLGLGLGYLAFSALAPASEPAWEAIFAPSPGAFVRNVSFQESADEAGRIELSFEAGKRYTLAGSPDDPRIQKLLTYALLHQSNDADRLRAVDTLSRGTAPKIDRETEAALIAALRMDENPAVRQESLHLLSQFADQPAVRDAVVQSLRFDPNARIRIEAIDTLRSWYSHQEALAPEVIQILRDRSETDENGLIRMRAKSLLVDAGFNQF